MRRTQPHSTEDSEPTGFSHACPTVAGYGPGENLSEYVEQARATLESQRLSFDGERAAFAEERRLWENERAMMQQRITLLERRLGLAVTRDWQSPQTGSSLSNPSTSTPKPTRNMPPSKRGYSDISPADYDGYGARPKAPPGDAPAPRSQVFDKFTFTKAPVGHVGSKADRPPSSSRDASSVQPTAESTETSTSAHENGGAAEHTVVPATAAGLIADVQTIHPQILAEEPPLAPQHTHDDLETQGSHSPRLDEDPALQGPLTLQNDKDLDHDFLQEVDEKLSDEARRPIPDSSASEPETSNNDLQDKPEPELRFKQSTNFGTAFGSSRCGIS